MEEKGEDTTELKNERSNTKYEEPILQKPEGQQRKMLFVFENLGDEEPYTP